MKVGYRWNYGKLVGKYMKMLGAPRRTLQEATLNRLGLTLKKGQKIRVDMGGPEGVGAYVITRLVHKKDGTTIMHVEELGTLPTLRKK